MSIRHKRKSTSGYTWSTSDLVDGQIGLNTADGTLHILKSGTAAIADFYPSNAQSMSGTVSLATGTRIRGDWNTTTYANRPAFQSSTGTNTYLTVLANQNPGITSTQSRGALYLHSTNDAANSNCIALTSRNNATLPAYLAWGTIASSTVSDPTVAFKFTGMASGTVYGSINPSGPTNSTDLVTKSYADAHYGGGLPAPLASQQANTGTGTSTTDNQYNELSINPTSTWNGVVQSALTMNTVTSLQDGPQFQIITNKTIGGAGQVSLNLLDYAAAGGPASTQSSTLYFSVGNTGSSGYDSYFQMTPVAGSSGIQFKSGASGAPVGSLTLEENTFNVNAKSYGFADPVSSDPVFGFGAQPDGSINANFWPGVGTGGSNMCNLVMQSYPFNHPNTHWLEIYAGTTGTGTLSPENCHIGVGRVSDTNLSIIPLYISNNGGSTMYTTGSLMTIGADAASDGLQYGSLGGDIYLNVKGDDFMVKTSGSQRFEITTSGEFKVGASANAGSAGQVLTSGGTGAEPTWANPAPVYTLATLPTAVAGFMITVSDANSGAGALCYSDGTTWKDAGTHSTVA